MISIGCILLITRIHICYKKEFRFLNRKKINSGKAYYRICNYRNNSNQRFPHNHNYH